MAENSSGNTGNKKAPQDRKPPQKRAEKKPEKGVDREVVSVGLDFRPLPIDPGDGKIWMFDPDPEPEAWSQLQNMLTTFGQHAKAQKGKTPEDIDVDDLPPLSDLLTDLRTALAEMLVDDGDQRDRFAKAGYGLIGLQRLAVTLVENLTGFPTK